MEYSPCTFPGCTILGELGRGTTGIVYKAWHTHLDELVAIKVLNQEAELDHVARVRFLREARLVASLTSTHGEVSVPTAYMVGEHDGHCFYVREYVEGSTLEEAAKSRSIDLGKGIAILAAIARAVERLHQHCIVHRNLDPSNILAGTNGKAKLIGFGKSRTLSDPGTPTELLTVDVQALQRMLTWLCSSLGQAVPHHLAAVCSDESLSDAAAFSRALADYLEQARHRKGFFRWLLRRG